MSVAMKVFLISLVIAVVSHRLIDPRMCEPDGKGGFKKQSTPFNDFVLYVWGTSWIISMIALIWWIVIL